MREHTISPKLLSFFFTVVWVFIPTSSLKSVSQENKPSESSPPQGAGGVAAGEPKFRLVRSMAGTKGGEQGGRFILEDPRTVFYFPDDRQIIVYLEWDGPTGSHQMEGRWKNPDGKPIVFSDIEYLAKQTRFGAFWTLTLSEGVVPGIWVLEAYIDGELAGAHSFQIVLAPRPANQEMARRSLTAAELYKIALGTTLDLRKLGPDGDLLERASAFVVRGGYVITSFDAIDGAQSLEVVARDGTRIPVEGVWLLNHRQDWAVLKVPGLKIEGLTIAKPDSWAVGDQYFTLDSPTEGGRTATDGVVRGSNRFSEFGPRIHLSYATAREASGSPILNDYGEVIGIMVYGSLLPGSWSLRTEKSAYPGNLSGAQSPYRTQSVLAVPINALTLPPASSLTPRSVRDLARSGFWTSRLVGYRNVWRCTLAPKVEKRNLFMEPVDEKFEFSRRDKQMAFLVSLNAKEKIKSLCLYRVYDMENRLLGEGKPVKLNLKSGATSDVWWEFDITQLRSGLYRIDFILGNDPASRTYFRMVD